MCLLKLRRTILLGAHAPARAAAFHGMHGVLPSSNTPAARLPTVACATGHLRLEEGTQMVMPGDNFRTGIELTLPVALEVGVRFAIRDSGRTVGAGVVTELIG